MIEFDNRFADAVHWTSPAAARAFERSNPQPNRLAVLVEHDGEIVAQGQTSDGGLWAPPDRTWRVGIRVAPDWRRKGIASALDERLEAHARERRASRLICGIRGAEPEGLAFAQTVGYREFHRRIDSYLDVASFDESRFGDPDEVAARAGVRLHSYEALARQHAADLESLQRTLISAFWEWARDVPSPAPLPAEPPPFDRARRMFFEEPGMDQDSTIIAIRGSTPLGVTATAVKENGVASTNFTGVARAERGKGLALAMKLRALRSLRRRGVRLFGTTNDEQNAAMRGINQRLGYVPELPTIMVEKVLA
jgi:GNAT superfamily N-acetyltransferase